MPLAKSSSSSKQGTGSSRLVRALRRTGSGVEPPPQTPSSTFNSSRRPPRQSRRVDDAENATGTSSSHAAPELDPTQAAQLAALLGALSPAPGSSSGTDIPTIQVEPPSAPSSTFLAQKIRGLMESWPALPSRFLSSRDVRGEDAGSVATATPLVDAEGRPIPPPGAVRIQDPELISLLSDPGIMNGADGRRQSVWSMLDAIAPPSRRVAESLNGEDEYAGSDRSSIMMYSPLIPSADSIIELAELEEAPVTQAPSSSGMWLSALWPASSWSAVWPFTGWKTGTVAEEQDNATTSTTEVLEPGSAAGQLVERHDPPVPVTRVWVPSTTQLSFETMWWGYRIYIPPPVLDILDDQSVEAAKQATTLTAALTWFFSNLPITAFPPPLQPAMLLLQRLTPVTSYIGTFISWSWSTIRGFDRGHGVILTATWLLPIALIPGTWHARDVPPPTNSSSPTPGSESGSAVFVPLSPPPYVELDPELLLPIPPAPMLPPVPLPPDDAPPPPPLRERKQKKKGMSTLRKLTRTLT